MSVIEEVSSLVEEHESRDPFKIAESLGIRLRYRNDYDRLLGMYANVEGIGYVFLNAKLDGPLKRMVMAHELAHHVLHREMSAARPFHDLALFDGVDKLEYEANSFAAALLIDEKALVDCAKNGLTDLEIARDLNVGLDLVLFKLKQMNELGYNFNLSAAPDAGFLCTKSLKLWYNA